MFLPALDVDRRYLRDELYEYAGIGQGLRLLHRSRWNGDLRDCDGPLLHSEGVVSMSLTAARDWRARTFGMSGSVLRGTEQWEMRAAGTGDPPTC